MNETRVVILGAAGRDFHNFNCIFRDNASYRVIAFTATQIPEIEGRLYPPSLAGKRYPEGISILSMDDLESLINKFDVDECYFSYSDTSYTEVMQVASRVLSAGAKFCLLPPSLTMLSVEKPAIGVVAVRTGSGKSQTARFIARTLNSMGKRVAVVRHPMAYGNLEMQRVQKFEEFEDLNRYQCTIEEREEYEHHIRAGNLVFAGVDYAEVLKCAEQSADIILWDGGNNDTPFVKTDLLITVADPLRAGHERLYYPGEINLMLADVVIINKVDCAEAWQVETIEQNAKLINPKARIICTRSPVTVDNPELIKGKRVLCVEDGPTLTHGEMAYGAAFIAAKKYGAKEIISPKNFAVGSIHQAFMKYKHLKDVLPALGYSKHQLKELEETIARVPCDTVIVGTPIDLAKIIKTVQPMVRAYYRLEEIEQGSILNIIQRTLDEFPALKK